jgi:hypothetical protein
MRKFLVTFIVFLFFIVVSISYMGTFYQESSSSSSSFSSILVQNEAVDLTKLQQQQQQKPPSKYNFIKKYPFVADCNLPTSKNLFNIYQQQTDTQQAYYNYSQEAAAGTHAVRIVKGVLVYFPIEQHAEYIHEFKWLYRSWIEMLAHEPANWRTDLVVFVSRNAKFFNDPTFFLNKLNCSFVNKRTVNTDPPMCTLVEYTPLKSRKLQVSKAAGQLDVKTNPERYEHVLTSIDIFSDDNDNLDPFYRLVRDKLSSYGYLDSILMAFDGYAYLKSAGYNYLIRSDMDVFLTPLFAKWLPRNCNDFYVGRGGYSTTFNVKRLERVARNLGLQFAAESNLGSTWYSTPDQFRFISYLTLFGMSYLTEEEFSQPEREGKVGVMLWPYWHYGVVLLYGQNLMMNHLIETRQLNIVKLEDHLDYPSYYSENIGNMLHIHVFHGDDMFSKFRFKAGAYDNVSYADKDVRVAKFYALKMALEAKRTPAETLLKNLLAETSKKT